MDLTVLRIKLRPRGSPQFEVTLPRSAHVSELKLLIAERLGTAPEHQRLIYQGKVLNSPDTLETCRIGDGHVIQLAVARDEPVRSDRPPSPRLEYWPNFLLTRRRRRIFPHREIEPNERFEVMRQSILTLDGLIQALASVPSQPLQPFDRRTRQFHRGQWVDVKDTVDQWLEAQVTDVQTVQGTTVVKVHYNGWPTRWDEWIEAGSPRIQPIRTNTLQTLNSPMHSAHLVFPPDAESVQTPTQYDFSEFVFQACGLLDHVKTMLDRFYVLKRIAAQERELDRRELTQESLQLIQLKPVEDKKTDDLRSDVSNFAISSVQEPLSDEEEAVSAMTTDQEALLISAQLSTILDRAGRLLSDIGVILSGAGVARRLDDNQSVSSSLLTNESGTSQVPTLPMQFPAMATPSELAAVAGPFFDLRLRTISRRRSAPSSPGESLPDSN